MHSPSNVHPSPESEQADSEVIWLQDVGAVGVGAAVLHSPSENVHPSPECEQVDSEVMWLQSKVGAVGGGVGGAAAVQKHPTSAVHVATLRLAHATGTNFSQVIEP